MVWVGSRVAAVDRRRGGSSEVRTVRLVGGPGSFAYSRVWTRLRLYTNRRRTSGM